MSTVRLQSPAPPLNIRNKQAFRYDGRLVHYRGRARDRDRTHLFEGTNGVPLALTDAGLLQAQQAGCLVAVRDPRAAGDEGAEHGTRATLDTMPQDIRPEVERRMAYVTAWRRAGEPARTEANLRPILLSVADTLDDPSPPSCRTLTRWLEAWKAAGGNAEGLVPQQGGNRSDRLSAEERELLQDTLERHYLVSSRPSVVTVMRDVRAAFEAVNAARSPGQHMRMPGRSTIYESVTAIDRCTLDYTRHGKAKAEHEWRVVGSGPVCERANEAWEIDHTRVDVIVVDEASGLPIGRPWVSVALDRHSRMVVGFRIGFEAPSAETALDLLRICVAPKDELLRTFPAVRGDWPCHGVPGTVVTDNGREFKSKSFAEACLRLGCEVEYTPVLKAWYKGRVERHFRYLAESVFHRIPGTTFSRTSLRGDIAPERLARVTLAKLREHVAMFLVDVYPNKVNRMLGGLTPLRLWNESVARHGIALPPSPAELLAATAHVVWRVPQRYGVEVEGLRYNGEALLAYRVVRGLPREVKVRVDPGDLARVSFVHPETGAAHELRVAEAMRSRLAGVTLEQHRMARALQRENPERLAGEEGLFRAYRLIDVAMQAGAKENGLANRVRAAAFLERQLRARLPAEDASAYSLRMSSASVAAPDDDGPGGEPVMPYDGDEDEDYEEELPVSVRRSARRSRAEDDRDVTYVNGDLASRPSNMREVKRRVRERLKVTAAAALATGETGQPEPPPESLVPEEDATLRATAARLGLKMSKDDGS